MRLVVIVAALSSACSVPSPTAPSPTPTPTYTVAGTLTATNGGQPLAGVQALLGATVVTTDASGGFSATLPQTGTYILSLHGPSIVDRGMLVGLTGSRTVRADAIALGGGFDQTFYRQLARNMFDGTTPQPIRRWTRAPNVYLQTAGVDARTLDMVEAVARDAIPRWSGLSVASIERGAETREGQAGWLTIKWNLAPSDRCGTGDVGREGGAIELWPNTPNCGCAGYAMRPTAVRHELGHAMGFWHTDSPDDVMFVVSNQCDKPITARELYHAAIAYRRPVGNVDPDTDGPGTISLAPMRVY